LSTKMSYLKPNILYVIAVVLGYAVPNSYGNNPGFNLLLLVIDKSFFPAFRVSSLCDVVDHCFTRGLEFDFR
jgi:hypothetical protein